MFYLNLNVLSLPLPSLLQKVGGGGGLGAGADEVYIDMYFMLQSQCCMWQWSFCQTSETAEVCLSQVFFSISVPESQW